MIVFSTWFTSCYCYSQKLGFFFFQVVESKKKRKKKLAWVQFGQSSWIGSGSSVGSVGKLGSKRSVHMDRFVWIGWLKSSLD